MAAHTVSKPIPGTHIGTARKPNVVRRNAAAFICRKSSCNDLATHQLQRKIGHGWSPAGSFSASVADTRYPSYWQALEAFRHGDGEVEEVPVWVNFHSNEKESNSVECRGPLKDAAKSESAREAIDSASQEMEMRRQRPRKWLQLCYYPPINFVARLFGPAIFEASKLKVLFLGVDEEKHPGNLPRAYTLTHSDITSKLTLAVSQTINKAQLQGWYNRLQRDEVVAEWKKAQGKMSLHVHCHISGGHWLLDAIAHLRFYIFRKELPVVLEAFRHGDEALFNTHPELEEALVWVYFHSNVKEFNRVECWGPLKDAAKGAREAIHNALEEMGRKRPKRCPEPCSCCYPPFSLIPWPGDCDADDLQILHRSETSVID